MDLSKERYIKIKNTRRCISYFYKIAWKNKPVYFFFVILGVVTNALSPFIPIVGAQYLINEIAYKENRRVSYIVTWVLFITIGTFIFSILKKIAAEKENAINREFERTLATSLNKKTMKMKFVDTENPKVLDEIQEASQALVETGVVHGITENLISMISSIFVLIGAICIVVNCSFILMIPVLISTITGIMINSKVITLRERTYKQMGKLWRASDYFSSVVIDKRYAKDVRLYPSEELLLSKQSEADLNVAEKEKEVARNIWSQEKIRIFVIEVCNIIVYLMLGLKALRKVIRVGELSSLIQYTIQFSNAMQQIVKGYLELQYTTIRLNCYIDFMSHTDEDENIGNSLISNLDEQLTIEFRNVSFRYPNASEYCVKNINIKICKSEHISIVGENGAGKSTLIKLLCRLYQVEEGEILLNGINILEYSMDEYISKLAVVFQDFKLLAFSVRDNITRGNNASDDELYKVCDNGGLSEWIHSTPNKLETVLYKMFEESGIEPSGGQAQKLSIARALYKNAPLIILDEPTAALDPISEYEIFTHFDRLVGGKTAIYISHRLSSCRFCDRIIVLHEGRIAETGTHDELMNIHDGYYKTMYQAQAKHYR